MPDSEFCKRLYLKKILAPRQCLGLGGSGEAAVDPGQAEETSPTGLPYRAAQPRQHFALLESLEGPWEAAFGNESSVPLETEA